MNWLFGTPLESYLLARSVKLQIRADFQRYAMPTIELWSVSRINFQYALNPTFKALVPRASQFDLSRLGMWP
jgi:hypothetical protein